MECFDGGKIEDVILLRLDYGDDLHECVEEIARKKDIQTGVIISAIGTLNKVRMQIVNTTAFPPKGELVELEGPIDVAGVHGIIADYRLHAHFTFYHHKRNKTIAGHLEPGCRICHNGELVVLKIKGISLTRIVHPETKVPQLKEGEKET